MRRLPMLILATVVLLVAGVAPTAHADEGGAAWPITPEPSGRASAQTCADVLFVGARGSLEAPPYGGTVTNFRNALAERTAHVPAAGRGTVREVYVDYPAVEPGTVAQVGVERLFFDAALPRTDYFASVQVGVDQVLATLVDSRDRCPDERWVLAGFSQGAEVLTRVLGQLSDPDRPLAADQLLDVTLLGNPTHYRGQAVTETGGDAGQHAVGLTASLFYVRHHVAAGRAEGGEVRGAANGIGAVVVLGQGRAETAGLADAAAENGYLVPPELAARVQSVCNAGDMVCDAGPALDGVLAGRTSLEREVERSTALHLGYQPDRIGPTVDRTVAAIVTVLPPPGPALPFPGPALPGAPSPWLALVRGWLLLTAVLGVATAFVLVARRHT